MIPKSFRWFALFGMAAMAFSFSGCLIEGPDRPTGNYTYLRFQPDYNLEAAPEGRIYELWAVPIGFVLDTVWSPDSTSMMVTVIGRPGVPKSIVRFQWDPSLFVARGEDDSILPITSDPGLDVGFNLADFGLLLVTIEPLNDDNLAAPDGPTLLIMYTDTEFPTNPIILKNPFQLLHDPQPYGAGLPAPTVAYTLISQSNKKGKTGVNWRDGSEGYGIWFCVPTVYSRTVFDSVGAFDTYTQIFVPPAPDSPFIYTIWINEAHPESSWSNFGRVFDSLEPDITFLDGVAQHPDTLKKGVTSVLNLGEEPIYIGGALVGYRYYSGDLRDTCDLRIDDPALTRCTRDRFDSLVFDVQTVTPRQFTLSQGDTSVSSSLGLIDVNILRGFARMDGDTAIGRSFEGWEYEAWLVFDKSSGIKPLSMGRFANPNDFDSDNSHCYAAGYDSNFAFPGEDFLRNLSQHDPRLTDSINVMTDSRVKKLWITIEPRHDPANGYVDWAPDEPFMQMIAASAWFPSAAQFVPDNNGVLPDATRPMSPIDRNPGLESLNEGHYWPTARVTFNQPTE